MNDKCFNVKNFYNLTLLFEIAYKIPPPLVGGDDGEGEIFTMHPHLHPPPSRGRRVFV